jgi:hypothetical protein
MFPKKGKNFPTGGGNEVYRTAVAAALRAELGDSHQAVKTVKASSRMAITWLIG